MVNFITLNRGPADLPRRHLRRHPTSIPICLPPVDHLVVDFTLEIASAFFLYKILSPSFDIRARKQPADNPPTTLNTLWLHLTRRRSRRRLPFWRWKGMWNTSESCTTYVEKYGMLLHLCRYFFLRSCRSLRDRACLVVSLGDVDTFPTRECDVTDFPKKPYRYLMSLLLFFFSMTAGQGRLFHERAPPAERSILGTHRPPPTQTPRCSVVFRNTRLCLRMFPSRRRWVWLVVGA